MIRGVILDVDNTLIDFMSMKKLAVKAAVDAMIDAGIEMKREEIEKKIYTIYEKEGIEYQFVFDKFLEEEFGFIDPKIKAASIVAYRKVKDGTLSLYPHVFSTLVNLIKMGIKLAVVSDAPELQAWLRLCQFNLQNFFDVIITPEISGAKKPSSIPFKMALEKMNIKAEEALMVGDWPEKDIEGAKKVGIKTVYAKYGDIFQCEDVNADYVINDFCELIEIIQKENEGG